MNKTSLHFTKMKNSIHLLLMILIMVGSLTSFSQTWSTSGNSASGFDKLGYTTLDDVNFITDDLTRMTLTANGWLGIGITAPRGWLEVNYCPPLGQSQTGSIITLNDCNSGSIVVGDIQTDIIGGGFGDLFTSGGADVEDEATPFAVPFTFLTGHSTNLNQPLYNTNSGPMFWVRKQVAAGTNPGTSSVDEFDTKFIVMPDGSCGINIAQPRAALDVRGSQARNRPAAIIGSRALGTGSTDPGTGLYQYYTQQVHFVPVLNAEGYNKIVKVNDQGMFFSDGKGAEGANQNSALVIAPWSSGGDTLVSGLRMDKWGNVGIGVASTNGHKLAVNGDMTINGKITCKNEFKVQEISVAWPDYVFRNYAENNEIMLSIEEMEAYVLKNHHLPAINSEKEIVENGFDVVENYANLLKQVELMSLQIIELNKKIETLSTK